MKKLIGLSLVFAILAVGFVLAQNALLCLETDSGYNPGQPGQMYWGEGVYDDYCMDSLNLHERYCVEGSGLPARGIQVYCPNGCVVNDVGLAGCAGDDGSIPSDGLFYQHKEIVVPAGWTPMGSNPVPSVTDNSGSQETVFQQEVQQQVAVPEFSVLAAGIAFAGAGLGYRFMRKRR
jgi:hypothetical protein